MNSSTTTTVFWILATYFFSVALCDDDIPISEPGSLPRVTLTPARVTVPSTSSDVTLTASAEPAPDGETIVVSYSVLVNNVENNYTVEFTSGQTETDVVVSIPAASPEGTVIDVALENDPSGSTYTVGGRNASEITVSGSDSVDGGWSSWVDPDPSSCNLCTDKLESTRTCTDPAPSGGGAPCEGESTRPYYCFDVQPSGCSFEVYVKMILAPGLPENVAIDALKTRFEEPTGLLDRIVLHQKAAVQQTATNTFSFLITPNDKGCDSSCIYSGLLGFDRNPIIHGIGEVVYINIFPEDTIPPICFNEERLVWRFYDPSVVSYTSSGAPTNECSDGTLSATGVRESPFMMYGPGYNGMVPIVKPIPSFNLSLYLQTYEEDGLVLISSAFVSLLGAEVVLRGNDLFAIPADNQLFVPSGLSKQHVQSKAQVEGFGVPFGEPLASFFPITAGEWIYFEVAVVEGEIRIKVGEEEFIPLTDFPAIGEFPGIGELSIIREGPVEGIEFDGPFFPPGFSHHRFELLSLGITGNVSGVIINTICQVDGWLAPGEECDDGNSVDKDGCSNSCKIVQEELCVCEEGEYTEIHLDRPSWMNEEPPSLAEDATKIFNVDCPNNAECCFTITRPYVKGGVWSIGGFSMEPGRDVLPFELPPESTDFQTDIYNGWESNNVEGKQGACFERIKANAPGSQWTTRTEGCDLIQTYCFNPIAAILPFECRNETTSSDDTGLPLFKVTCDIYLDLLRPKHSNEATTMYGWPTSSYLKWGNRLHTTIAIDLGVVVTSTLDYVTPYINTQVDEMGYLIGNVELDFGGTQWTAFKITESKLGSWESELNGDGTNSTGDLQKDANDNALGYELTLRNNHNVAIKSNSVRNIYVDTIYLRLELEDNTGASTNVTLKVEIKARNIVVDKSQNPIGLNIQPVVKILQRDPTAPRDLNTAVVPSYPVLSIEDLFVMEVPRTDNDNLRLSSITATLHRTNPINGELIRPPVAVLIDDNTPIASPLWEFQLADASYIQSKELSTAYSFRLAVEAGSYAIEQTLIFEVYYGEGGPAHQKMKVQQVTKPASLQTTTQLTVSVGFNGEEILQIETDVNTIDSNNNNEENGNNGNSETTPNVVVIDTQKPQNVNVGGNTDSQSSPLVTGIIAGSIGAVVVVVIIALVILVILKFKQQDNDMENRPLTPRTKQQQMDMNL